MYMYGIEHLDAKLASYNSAVNKPVYNISLRRFGRIIYSNKYNSPL